MCALLRRWGGSVGAGLGRGERGGLYDDGECCYDVRGEREVGECGARCRCLNKCREAVLKWAFGEDIMLRKSMHAFFGGVNLYYSYKYKAKGSLHARQTVRSLASRAVLQPACVLNPLQPMHQSNAFEKTQGKTINQSVQPCFSSRTPAPRASYAAESTR